MLEECFAGPDPKNPPFIGSLFHQLFSQKGDNVLFLVHIYSFVLFVRSLGIWHPGKGKKTVLVWDPDEEVEYETGSDYTSEEEDEDEEVTFLFRLFFLSCCSNKKLGSCLRIC